MKKLLMTASAAFLALGTAASAASLSIDGTAGSIPGVAQPTTAANDFLSTFGLGTDSGAVDSNGVPIFELGGFFGSTVSVSGPVLPGDKLLVEFFGAEATFKNQFVMDGNTFQNNGVVGNEFAADLNTPLASFTSAIVGTGPLAFDFVTNGGNPSVGPTISNGSNPGNVSQNFFSTFGPGHEGAQVGNVLWLFFDDAGQTGDNHDDLIVRISVVPLPAGAVLLLTGIAGFGAMRRRKKA